MDHKQDIIDILEKLRKKEQADKEVWKARAYAVVIKELKAKEGPVITIEDVKGLKGVGEKILVKIEEIIETGKLKQVQQYDQKYDLMNELMKIHGIGNVKAKELVEVHGIQSIEELETKQELLNDKQKMGLKYWKDFVLRIPRKEMEKHETFIKSSIHKINPELISEIVGSYRRGAKDSGDIDVLITHPNREIEDEELKNIVKYMEKEKYCVDTFALGNKKYLGVCKVKYGRHFRRLDLLITKKHEFPFAILYFTGDFQFNIEMRNICLEQGLTLSEYGLKYVKGPKKGQFVEQEFESEQDIFKFLGFKYVKPSDRKSKALEKLN